MPDIVEAWEKSSFCAQILAEADGLAEPYGEEVKRDVAALIQQAGQAASPADLIDVITRTLREKFGPDKPAPASVAEIAFRPVGLGDELVYTGQGLREVIATYTANLSVVQAELDEF